MVLAWAIASGAVLHYELYVDNVLIATTPINQATFNCVEDDDNHLTAVVAVGFDGERIWGDTLAGTYTQWRLQSGLPAEPPVTSTGPTPTAISTSLPSTPTPRPIGCSQHPAVCADLDGDGVVGLADYGIFATWFGHCNDGGNNEPCP
jgi:hypothetical protein